MLENIGLMKGIGGKMNWLNQRQTVLSQNIANADTPSYRPHDLEKIDFSEVMGRASSRPKIDKVTTNGAHIGANPEVGTADNRKSKVVYEAAPGENAVVIEEQLLKAGKTQSDYNMMTNLYKKSVGMLQLAVSSK
jgi:flagellar basal-body rod protein FlgB